MISRFERIKAITAGAMLLGALFLTGEAAIAAPKVPPQVSQHVPQQVPMNAANTAYNEAYKFLTARNYGEAARVFYQLASQASGDVRAQSEFGLAESLRNLGYLHGASYFYLRIAMQGTSNRFFRNAMEQLGVINGASPMGRATVAPLFSNKVNIDPMSVPPGARGFYFYYKGLEAFEREQVDSARAEFQRVPENSPYFSRAQYHLGVMSAISTKPDLDAAVRAFRTALRSSHRDNFRMLSMMSLARIHYERKEIRQAFEYYSQIPRESDLWLQSIFEGSWAYFVINKSNNTLGNIHTLHSPFFHSRFFPESYVLEAITYLKLCYFNKVDLALKSFQQRYKATFQDLNNLLKKYQGQSPAFFNLHVQYRNSGSLREFPAASEIIDSASRSDSFKEASFVIKSIDREEKSVARAYSSRWENVGLMDVLRNAYEQRRISTIRRSGSDLFSQSVLAFRYLKDLSDQTKLIHYERATSQTDALRAKFNVESTQTDTNVWGEGMKPLDLAKSLEYWPFEGEWWEDELGGYVYNVSSKCGNGSAAAPAAAPDTNQKPKK